MKVFASGHTNFMKYLTQPIIVPFKIILILVVEQICCVLMYACKHCCLEGKVVDCQLKFRHNMYIDPARTYTLFSVL